MPNIDQITGEDNAINIDHDRFEQHFKVAQETPKGELVNNFTTQCNPLAHELTNGPARAGADPRALGDVGADREYDPVVDEALNGPSRAGANEHGVGASGQDACFDTPGL